jgi:hypothetical protein
MSVLSVQSPYPIFTDTDGDPLESGYIWIGVANLDPQVNPLAVYWDAALTMPAVQPIRTLAGYPSQAGSPGRLYTTADHSIRVQNKRGTTVFTAGNVRDRFSADFIGYTGPDGLPYTVQDFADSSSALKGDALIAVKNTGLGGVNRTQHDKNNEFVSVKDFGAIGNGIVDDTTAIQNTINTGKSVYFPNGTYLCGALTVSTNNQSLFGFGDAVILANSDAIQQITISGDKQTICGLTFQGIANSSNATPYFAIYTTVTPASNLTITDCKITGTDSGHGWRNGIKLTIACNSAIICNNRIDSLWGSADGGYAILVSDSNRCNISDNIIIGDYATKTRGRHGVYLSAGASYNVVSRNNIYGMYEAGITHYSQGAQDDCDSNIISNNFVVGCSRSTNVAGGGITIGGKSTRCMCINNHVYDSGANGITLDATGYGTAIAPVAYGNIVRGNRVYSSGTFGITMINQDSFIISDNDIRASSIAFSGVYSHICLDNVVGGFACQNGVINNNKCDASTTARYSLVINAAFATTNVSAYANYFPACVTSDIYYGISVVPINGIIWSVTSWDPASIAAASNSSTTVAVAGSSLNDIVHVTLRGGATEMVAGLVITAFVSVPGTVTITLANLTAAAIDPVNTVLTIAVIKR